MSTDQAFQARVLYSPTTFTASFSHSAQFAAGSGNFSTSTHFGGDTGSVSPTPSGVYAFWPIMGGPGKGSIGSAKSLDPKAGLGSWDQRGPTIPMPKRINAGFRDPVRAFEYPEKSGQWVRNASNVYPQLSLLFLMHTGRFSG